MTAGRAGRRSRWWRALWPLAVLALIVAGYAIARAAFLGAAGSEGLVTPSGSPDGGVIALGVALLVMRITAFAGVPGIAAYVVVRRLVDWIVGRLVGASRASTSDGAGGPPGERR